MDPIERLKNNLHTSIEAKHQLLAKGEDLSLFAKAVAIVVERYKRGGRIYIAGNGGSAADAQHLAAEFVSKLARDRALLPAEALTVDSSILTAIGNDYGFEQVFSRQLAGKLTEKDVFLGITTSGNSPNILSALEQCEPWEYRVSCFAGGQVAPPRFSPITVSSRLALQRVPFRKYKLS